MSIQAELGKEVTIDNQKYLVVRIIHSHTLFEGVPPYTLEEHYAQLQGEVGQVKFIMFGEPIKRIVEPTTMKGLDPSVWQKF